jgi:glutamate formiminotransferase/formiminotetrahydrofolate cyclodeaminase
MTLRGFAAELAADTPTPGGGSAAAYVGALAASLGAMVANLSANKRGWEDRLAYFSDWAERGQAAGQRLLQLVDEDTAAFNTLMDAFRMPKDSDNEKKARSAAIQAATLTAIRVPLETLRAATGLMDMLEAMAREGNPNSVSDAGVGALCAQAAAEGGWFNVHINLGGLKDKAAGAQLAAEADRLLAECKSRVTEILAVVRKSIAS